MASLVRENDSSDEDYFRNWGVEKFLFNCERSSSRKYKQTRVVKPCRVCP